MCKKTLSKPCLVTTSYRKKENKTKTSDEFIPVFTNIAQLEFPAPTFSARFLRKALVVLVTTAPEASQQSTFTIFKVDFYKFARPDSRAIIANPSLE